MAALRDLERHRVTIPLAGAPMTPPHNSGPSDNSGPGSESSGPGHDGDDDGEHGDDDRICTTAELVPGAVVEEAELKLENGKATFKEVELSGKEV